MGRGPLHYKKVAKVLQTIGAHWKVHFAIYVLIHIDQTLSDALGISFVSFRQCRYRSGFVTAVMIDWCLRVLGDLLHKWLPYVAFVLIGIRPEGIVLRDVSLTHEHANQVIESPVRDTLHVHKQRHML